MKTAHPKLTPLTIARIQRRFASRHSPESIARRYRMHVTWARTQTPHYPVTRMISVASIDAATLREVELS